MRSCHVSGFKSETIVESQTIAPSASEQLPVVSDPQESTVGVVRGRSYRKLRQRRVRTGRSCQGFGSEDGNSKVSLSSDQTSIEECDVTSALVAGSSVKCTLPRVSGVALSWTEQKASTTDRTETDATSLAPRSVASSFLSRKLSRPLLRQPLLRSTRRSMLEPLLQERKRSCVFPTCRASATD